MDAIDSDQIYPFDVDDTLVIWDDKFQLPGDGRIRIVDPYDGEVCYLRPHVRHVKLLTQMKGRNRFIIVWSQSGMEWARAVVNALNLQDSVDLVMTKPAGYVDDLKIEEWCKNHIYLPPEK